MVEQALMYRIAQSGAGAAAAGASLWPRVSKMDPGSQKMSQADLFELLQVRRGPVHDGAAAVVVGIGLEINVGKDLPVGVLDGEALFKLSGGPGRWEAAGIALGLVPIFAGPRAQVAFFLRQTPA